MREAQLPTVSGRVRSRLLPYLVILMVLWMAVLKVTDFLPKDGELIPRGGTWRPATEADCVRAFLWYTACWYGGALLAFGLVWRVARVVYDTVFGGEHGRRM